VKYGKEADPQFYGFNDDTLKMFDVRPYKFRKKFAPLLRASGVPRNFFGGGGVQQIELRTEGRENEGFSSICK
jgi:hypothetical protein